MYFLLALKLPLLTWADRQTNKYNSPVLQQIIAFFEALSLPGLSVVNHSQNDMLTFAPSLTWSV